eukprot:Hpha_TRINITY_DN17586_c0_g1::TRINITY_DN17586_c0_g1_i1::g.92461::m.92461
MEEQRRWWWKCSDVLIKGEDTAIDVRIKRILTPVVVVVVPINLLYLLISLIGTGGFLTSAAQSCALVAFLMIPVCGGMGLRMGRTLDVALVLLAAGTVLVDADAALSLMPRMWALVVIWLDLALVFERKAAIPVVVLMLVLWLLVESAESGYRFGLYTAVHGDSEIPHLCDCALPPCKQTVVSLSGSLFLSLLVLALDFYLTRGFANNLHVQLRRVKSSVEVAADVASALARYDIDKAQIAIADGENLPEELTESYLHLLRNLQSYRNYLPDALLQEETSESPRARAVPPPVGHGEEEVCVGMVFTDIQSSTALWEEYPHDMYEALQTHNQA